MKAYKALVKFCNANNANVSVWDGEEWQVKRSAGYQSVIDAIESVEVAELRIRDQAGNIIGWAQIIPDLEDDETLADYTMTPFMEQFEDHMTQEMHKGGSYNPITDGREDWARCAE